MPLSFSIDHESGMVIVRSDGVFNDDVMLAYDSRLRGDPEFRPEYHQLVDLRLAKGNDVTPAGVRALVARPPLFSPESLRAIVVSTTLGVGMARMYELLRADKSGHVRVFTDLAEAEAWLIAERGA